MVPSNPAGDRSNQPRRSRELDAIRDQFELAWTDVDRPRIEDFLNLPPPTDRRSLFAELLASELALRGCRNEICNPADYTQRFPQYLDVVAEIFKAKQAELCPAQRDFLSVAAELSLLSPQLLSQISQEATTKQIAPSQLALRKGLLDAVQVDIIETLMRPTEAVPGYEILGVVGQGGMGVVYRARQLNLKRIVALKTVLVSHLRQDTTLERFEREAQVLARFTHPHIVTAFDLGRYEGRLYFAMELVDGEDAHRLIRRRGALDEWAAWGIVRQAAAGLAHAADHGIVHRDIKPANLLLVERPAGFPLPAGLPMVKIADFGLAQLAASTDEQSRLTSVGSAVGSPNYASPEQLLGQQVDVRSDIFSLGATAFHLLDGKPPLAGKTLTEIIAMRMRGEVESVRDVRPAVSDDSVALVAAMMAHDPEKRLANYRELMRRIDALAVASSGSAATASFSLLSAAPDKTPPATNNRPSTWLSGMGRRTTRTGLALSVCTLLVVVILTGIIFRGRSSSERDLTPSGRIEDLFNGQNINQWKPVSGSWNPAKDNEGALVLQGQGFVRRSIVGHTASGEVRPLEHYRLTFVVDLHEAAAVEVQFDIAAERQDEHVLFVQINHDGCTLGSRSGVEGSSPTVVAQRTHPAKGSELHAIEIERQGRQWWAMVDGQLLGRSSFVHAMPAREFRLLAEGGLAWFSDFTIEELGPAQSVGR